MWQHIYHAKWTYCPNSKTFHNKTPVLPNFIMVPRQTLKDIIHLLPFSSGEKHLHFQPLYITYWAIVKRKKVQGGLGLLSSVESLKCILNSLNIFYSWFVFLFVFLEDLSEHWEVEAMIFFFPGKKKSIKVSTKRSLLPAWVFSMEYTGLWVKEPFLPSRTSRDARQ